MRTSPGPPTRAPLRHDPSWKRRRRAGRLQDYAGGWRRPAPAHSSWPKQVRGREGLSGGRRQTAGRLGCLARRRRPAAGDPSRGAVGARSRRSSVQYRRSTLVRFPPRERRPVRQTPPSPAPRRRQPASVAPSSARADRGSRRRQTFPCGFRPELNRNLANRGTGGSNPSPSSEESDANLTSS